MAGRNHNHIPSHALNLREVPLTRAPHPEDVRFLHRGPPPLPHPAVVEERVAFQQREIQSLLLDNQRLAATHVALKQEFSASQQEIRHLSTTAATVKSESDAQVREIYDKSLKMEAEVRSIDRLNSEVAQVRADVQKLSSDRREIASKLKAVEDDVARTRSELEELPAIKAEIEVMHQEIQKGRAAIEYEKHMYSNNVELSQDMEKHMISMAREIEKLRAELANAEKRAMEATVAANPSPGYAVGYGNTDVGYASNFYSDPYAMHQVQSGAEAGPIWGPGAAPNGPYDMQLPHVHR